MARKTHSATPTIPTAAASATIANEQDARPAAASIATGGGIESTDATPPATSSKPPRDTKLAAVEALLRRQGGASIAEVMSATGWQQHSVRGVLAGTLKRKGLVIGSAKIDGERRYHIATAA